MRTFHRLSPGLFTLLYTHLLMTRTCHIDFYTRTLYGLLSDWRKLRSETPDDGVGNLESKYEYPISPPTQTHNILPSMSVLLQPLSDVTPVVAEATVLSTEVRMTPTRRTCRHVPHQSLQVTPGEKTEEKEQWIHLTFTWSKKNFTLDIAESDRSVCSVYSGYHPANCLEWRSLGIVLCAQSIRSQGCSTGDYNRARREAENLGSCQGETPARSRTDVRALLSCFTSAPGFYAGDGVLIT